MKAIVGLEEGLESNGENRAASTASSEELKIILSSGENEERWVRIWWLISESIVKKNKPQPGGDSLF